VPVGRLVGLGDPGPTRTADVVTRRTVRVELDRRSATLRGPRLMPALDLAGCRWIWHPHHHKAVLVPLADLDDLLAALEVDAQRVEFVDRYGDPWPYGGLLAAGSE
jgi:hypothetical protein